MNIPNLTSLNDVTIGFKKNKNKVCGPEPNQMVKLWATLASKILLLINTPIYAIRSFVRSSAYFWKRAGGAPLTLKEKRREEKTEF